jgi:hypothetical protein
MGNNTSKVRSLPLPISSFGTAKVSETLEDKYNRLYDQYYDSDKGMFDFGGSRGELKASDFFGGLENDFRKREMNRRKKENLLGRFFGAGSQGNISGQTLGNMVKEGTYEFPTPTFGGGQASGQTLGNMANLGTYKFPSSTVQKARGASVLPVTQAMSSMLS